LIIAFALFLAIKAINRLKAAEPQPALGGTDQGSSAVIDRHP